MGKSFVKLANEIGELVTEKNKKYGNSFSKTAAFLNLLFPDGIKPDQYEDLGCLFRMWDKMMRLATDKDAFGESPYSDLAGYSLLGLKKDLDKKEAEASEADQADTSLANALAGELKTVHDLPSGRAEGFLPKPGVDDIFYKG